MSERWCAKGNHFTERANFDARGQSGLARDCRACRARTLEPATGADIDRIHFKRGLVAPHLLRKVKT